MHICSIMFKHKYMIIKMSIISYLNWNLIHIQYVMHDYFKLISLMKSGSNVAFQYVYIDCIKKKK